MTITSTEAQLFVRDVRASCEFYAATLGFKVVFMHGEPPTYAQVARDCGRLNLRAVDEPVFLATRREREALLSATLTLGSAEDVNGAVFVLSSQRSQLHARIRTPAVGGADVRDRRPGWQSCSSLVPLPAKYGEL